MDRERKQILLLACLTIVIVGIAYLSVRSLRGGASSTSNSTTATPATGSTATTSTTDIKGASQQAKDIASLQTATAFVWKDFIPLSAEPYFRNEFYSYRESKTTKLSSKNGTLTDVFTAKGAIYFVVDQKRLFEFNAATGQETSLVDGAKLITHLAVSPDGTKIAFSESETVEDAEKITIKIWDKSNRTMTELAKIGPLGLYFGFTHLIWSQKYNQIYVVSQGGDGGYARADIYQVDQATKAVTKVTSFDSAVETASADIVGFDATGDSFFVHDVTGSSESPTQSTLKQYDVSTLKATELYVTTDAATIGYQDFAFGPKGTPVVVGNMDVNTRGIKSDALGFFNLQQGKLTKLDPGVTLNYSGINTAALPLAANDTYALYGGVDKDTYRVYLSNTGKKQVSLVHAIPNVSIREGVFVFLGWVK